jgi:hypothetical protein
LFCGPGRCGCRKGELGALQYEKEIVMKKTVVGLVDTREQAQSIVDDLLGNAFNRDDISFVSQYDHGNSAVETTPIGGAEIGARTGAAVGGIGGFLVGIAGVVGFALTGIGAVIAAGPLVTTLAGAGAGAVAGGLIGALTHMGVSEKAARYFAEGIREGGILVTVSTDVSGSEKAMEIMNRHGAITEWNEDGTPRRPE